MNGVETDVLLFTGTLVLDTNGVEVFSGIDVELTNGVETGVLVFNGALVFETSGVDVFNGADVEFVYCDEAGVLMLDTSGVEVFNAAEELTDGVEDGTLELTAVGMVALVN